MDSPTDSAQEIVEHPESAEEGMEANLISTSPGTNDKQPEYIWCREMRKIFLKSRCIAQFEVQSARILPTQEHQPNSKKYVLYKIKVQMGSLKDDAQNDAIIERRYTTLYTLYENLRKDYAEQLQSITFPKKKIIGNFSPSLIGERSIAFETFLDYIISVPVLRDSEYFLEFLQGEELTKSGLLLDERRNEQAVAILTNCFKVLNKIYLDKSKPVLLLLCRLVAACTTSPIPLNLAEEWAALALRRFEHVSDVEILVLYIPLLQTCVNLYNLLGNDSNVLEERLRDMGKRGIKIKGTLSLQQAIHAMDPRSETA